MDTFENTKVIILNNETLEKDLQEMLGEPAELFYKTAFIVRDGKLLGSIVTEIGATEAENGMVKVPISKKKEGFLQLYHTWEVSFDISDIEKYKEKEITLAEFVKDRRDYNSRLANNERLVLQWLNS